MMTTEARIQILLSFYKAKVAFGTVKQIAWFLNISDVLSMVRIAEGDLVSALWSGAAN